MKHFLATMTIGASLALAMPALAEDAGMAKVGDIMIHDGWARASIGSAPNSAAYMTLVTEGADVDRLVAASTPAADRAELHTHLMEDGVAKMRQVEAIEVAPGEATPLKPGGLHIMLMDLKGELAEGTSLPVTLTFENAGEVTLELPVRDLRGGMKHGTDHKHGS